MKKEILNENPHIEIWLGDGLEVLPITRSLINNDYQVKDETRKNMDTKLFYKSKTFWFNPLVR